MSYLRKYIYFNEDNLDVYDYLMSKGRGSSQYVCNLVRREMNNEIPSIHELNERLKKIEEMTVMQYYEIQPKKEDVANQNIDFSKLDF